MSSSVLLVPGQPISRFHLEGVRDGLLELDQWGKEVPIDPEVPEGEKRRITYFEVIRKPGEKPEISAADALLYFTTTHAELPDVPVYLGTVVVTDSYINDRFWRE